MQCKHHYVLYILLPTEWWHHGKNAADDVLLNVMKMIYMHKVYFTVLICASGIACWHMDPRYLDVIDKFERSWNKVIYHFNYCLYFMCLNQARRTRKNSFWDPPPHTHTHCPIPGVRLTYWISLAWITHIPYSPINLFIFAQLLILCKYVAFDRFPSIFEYFDAEFSHHFIKIFSDMSRHFTFLHNYISK